MSDELKWWLIGGGFACLLIIIISLVIFWKHKNKIRASEEFPELLEALGGADNISNVSLNGSRISLVFDNKKSLDKELIKENGVETIVVSNKKMTLVIGKQAPEIYKYLSEIKKEA